VAVLDPIVLPAAHLAAIQITQFVALQQVLDVPQAQRKTDIHHDHQADHLGREIETAERTGRLGPRFATHSPQLAAAQDQCHIARTVPALGLRQQQNPAVRGDPTTIVSPCNFLR
jgi:hypothetical protein